MPRRRSTITDELFVRRHSWGYKLAKYDSDFRSYIGTPPELLDLIVRTNVVRSRYIRLLKNMGVINELQGLILDTLIDLRLEYLRQLNKAYFASVRAGEVTQLGMFLGAITASKKRRSRETEPEEAIIDDEIFASYPETEAE